MTNIRMLSRFAPAALLALALALLAFASGGADAQSGNARLRVLHASPDAPAVDVYLDGAEAVSDLAINSITDYVSVPAGSHTVEVFPASANGSGTPVIDASVTLNAGTDYTVAAVGRLASIEPLVLTDNNAAPPSGKAKLRVVHASPDAPAVDVFAEGAGVIVPNAPFKAASDYLELAAGTYNLEVRAAGTDTVALDLPGVALEAGKVYTAFAVGLLNGSPALQAKLTVDATPAQATATPVHLPSTGGLPPSESSTLSGWLIVGALLAATGLGVGSLALVRARNHG